MDVALLVVEGCPSEGLAAVLLRKALDDVGLDRTWFSTRTVRTVAEAEKLHFLGSPTFMIDGKDAVAGVGQRPGLSCRVYRGDSGDVSALPSITTLRQALKRAAVVHAN